MSDWVRVQHARGTSNCRHVNRNAKQYWINNSDYRWPRTCCFATKDHDGNWVACDNDAVLGAHVLCSSQRYGTCIGIVPCCSHHNSDRHLDKVGHVMEAKTRPIELCPSCDCHEGYEQSDFRDAVSRPAASSDMDGLLRMLEHAQISRPSTDRPRSSGQNVRCGRCREVFYSASGTSRFCPDCR